MEPIGNVARALGRDISKARSATTSRAEALPPLEAEETCPRCSGIGWLRYDVPVGSPDFGRIHPCSCRADEVARRRLRGAAVAGSFGALERMTFDSFVLDAPGNTAAAKASLKSAHAAALRFADEPRGWLVLTGGYGCGKTHLAAAIVNARAREGHVALFAGAADLLDGLRAAMGDEDGLESRLQAIRETPVLVLDDLGAEVATPWANEKLYRILNYRYTAALPTVITMNGAAEELDDRLRSRLGDIELVRNHAITALDYRGGVDHGRSQLASLQHYRDQTFETWSHRSSELAGEDATNLLKAFDAARGFAQAPAGWIVYQGPPGVGKTHLAAAIANYQKDRGERPILVVVPDLLDHLRSTFSPSSRVPYDHRFEEVREAPLLILDDLGTESATPWAREKLFQILNHRYVAALPTVITTSSNMAELPARLRTRMSDRRRCRIYAIVVPAMYGGGRPTRGGRD